MMRGRALNLINGCRRLLVPPCCCCCCSSSSLVQSISCRRQAHDSSSSDAPAQIQKNPSASSTTSPFVSKLQKILRAEIQYQHDYAPPHQPVTEFDKFIVEDQPGETWITLRGKLAEDENIKIEATMFDGSILAPKSDDDDTEEIVRLHISMLVDIWKEGGTDSMEFVCSAWPDSLEIQKVYILRRDDSPAQPSILYMGPDTKNLNNELQAGFYKFLNARGVNDDLSKFLHQYMMNKDRIELLHWLGKVQSYFEK